MRNWVENSLMTILAALNGFFFASLVSSFSHSSLVSPVATVSAAFLAISIFAYLWVEKLYICAPVKAVTK